MKKSTRNRIFVAALSASCFVLLSFQLRKYEVRTVDLEEVITGKLIDADFTANGSYSGKSVVCRLTNLTAAPLKIRVPAGTYFVAPDEGEQNLLVPGETFITVLAKGRADQVLDGFCTEASDRCPDKDGKFTLGKQKIPKMNELLAFLKGKKYDDHMLQDAIWVLSDGHDISNVYNENDAVAQPLRAELSRLTGQKEPWYSAPQYRTVDEDGTINRETVAIHGTLKFNSTKGAKVHEELQDAEGQVLYKMEDTEIALTGEVSYSFNVKVKGWKRGKYYVKVLEGTKILKTFEFSV